MSTTPPNSKARLLWTHMENPARGPGGIPPFFTYKEMQIIASEQVSTRYMIQKGDTQQGASSYSFFFSKIYSKKISSRRQVKKSWSLFNVSQAK